MISLRLLLGEFFHNQAVLTTTRFKFEGMLYYLNSVKNNCFLPSGPLSMDGIRFVLSRFAEHF